ncbi:MAG: hypothetical protein ACRDHM_05895 [Actinomycetota bacterium]
MNKLFIGAVAVLALIATPAAAQTEPVPTPPCAVSEEYPTVGLDGKHEDVDSPLLPDSLQALGEPFTSQTYVSYKYRLDISGSAEKPFATKANVAIDLNWDNDGDFDLYVYDSTDSLIGSSTDFVADRIESVVLVGAPQCTDFRIQINNFLAPPSLAMTLDTKVSSLKP